ncbi:radical SAM protein [Nonomuraea diastatica]|uniref:Radical SAM protein n=1 Tax=Nonomuraea diastatica TaxID=1848329 RepID=A0A4R4W3I1_9ACTN|nr:radical SAM protein [Nonomuraea diastatica]
MEITGRCQLECVHCYANSGPHGSHGTMAYSDWAAAIDQAAKLGTSMVQFIGGEPTLHPALPSLITHALDRGVEVEVHSNLVHVADPLWDLFALSGVRLATSYYTDDPDQHQRITGRHTLERTRAKIARAVARGIPIRVGIIDLGDDQRVQQAHADLTSLGVTRIEHDRMRVLGRPARGQCDASELCGNCGDGIAAILPDGTVTPCPLARWLTAGNLRTTQLSSLIGEVRRIASTVIAPALAETRPCQPNCTPGCDPSMTAPGGGDGCVPKARCEPNKPAKDPCAPEFKCRPKGK